MKKVSNRIQLTLLAVTGALLLHIIALFYLQELPIGLKIASGNWASDKRNALTAMDNPLEKQRQLKQVFKELQRDASPNNVVTAPVAALTRDVGATVIEDLFKQEIPLSPTKAIDLMLTPDQTLASERREAADKLLGEVQLQLQNLAQEGHKLYLGTPDEASVQGAALYSQSGLFHQLAASALDTAMASNQLRDQIARGISGERTGASGRKSGGSEGGLESEGSIAGSNDFILSIAYAPARHGPGYLFRLTLTPKPQVLFKRIAHNFFFLLDRSSSIGRSRYDVTKNAVRKTLDNLHPGDFFNILVFDDHVASLAPEALPINAENLEFADLFLSRHSHGGLFAATDLYGSLGNIIPEAVMPQEIYSAILFSDGDTLLSSEGQRKTIAAWTNHNQGKVSLYAVAVGEGNNLPLLDLLTVCNRGFLSYSHDEEGILSTLTNLVDSIRTPIGKEITVTPVMTGKQKPVILYPPRHRSPHLYCETPYVLHGFSPDLKGFYLFLQGRYYDKWLDIKQQVTFDPSHQVPLENLEMDIDLERAYIAYEAFLREGDLRHLAEAKALLKPYHMQTAFDTQ